MNGAPGLSPQLLDGIKVYHCIPNRESEITEESLAEGLASCGTILRDQTGEAEAEIVRGASASSLRI